MKAKILVIISTAEKEKALTGIMYAFNAIKNQWVDDLKVIFFGPFENLLGEDPEVAEAARRLLTYQKPTACKFLADRDGISDQLEQMGMDVDYVGAIISAHVAEGYVPMVF